MKQSEQNELGKNACPTNLPRWDDGLDKVSYQLSFPEVIRAAAAHADVVMFGDTNHFDPNVRGIMGEDKNLKALKDAGFTHISVEVPKTMQHWVDKFNRDELTQQEFEDSIHLPLQPAQGNENKAWTRQLVKTAAFAKENNMQLVFADPKNGMDGCSSDLEKNEFEKCEEADNVARFRDNALSMATSSVLKENPNHKVFQIYGQAHYSVDNGSKEEIDGRVLKLDVYKNRGSYESDVNENKEPNSEAEKLGWGGVKPDMIYMIDTRDAYTTCSTPRGFREDLITLAKQNSSTSPPVVISNGKAMGLSP